RIKCGTIFDLAMKLGWRFPEVPPTGDTGNNTSTEPEPPEFYSLADGDPYANVEWMVDQMLPSKGHGILAGQWGMFKTLLAIDLSGAVMTGGTFAGRAVRRCGGALYFAPEGASEIHKRMTAWQREIAKSAAPLPFLWVDRCPVLLAKGTLEFLKAKAKRA